jgi:hypothetical protein
MQVAQQTDSLHRHYDASRNPIHVWKAVHLFAGQQPREPFPEWVMSYLGSGARKIVLMGEGLDWTAEPAPPPPAERNKETLAEYGRQHSAWSQALDYKSGQSHAAIGRAYDAEPSLNYSKVNRLVLKALGFSAVTGKNFFSEYFNMLCMQEYVREYNHSSSEQDRLWRYARQHARERLSRLGPSRLAQPAIWENITEKPVTDPSNCRRIVQEAQRYLERGRIEPEPLGPVNAWIAQRQHRKFLKDIE